MYRLSFKFGYKITEMECEKRSFPVSKEKDLRRVLRTRKTGRRVCGQGFCIHSIKIVILETPKVNEKIQ